MKQYYKNSEGQLVKTNNPSEPLTLICSKEENEKFDKWMDRSKKEYKRLCKERNEEIEQEQLKLDEQLKVDQERDKLIKQKMYEMAEQELIKNKIIQPLEVKNDQ